MVSISALKTTLVGSQSIQYRCQANLNLYDSPTLQSLATQAVAGRQLRILSLPSGEWDREAAIQVRLCEDDYPGWLAIADLNLIELAEKPYRAIAPTESEIHARLPQVIAYARRAMAQPNHYLWGGTIGPNYDCSGLIQAAFTAAGIWLPRDAYQQAAFTQPVDREALQPGDLAFFGSDVTASSGRRITHVGLYLGKGCYIHSSGKDQGRDGIAIDLLSAQGDAVAQAYYHQFQKAGRVVAAYMPQL